MFHPVGFYAPNTVAPTVSPSTNNRNVSDDIATTYSCLQYSNDGYERVNNNVNAVEYNNTAVRGLWLDSGSASDVWLERTINSGSLYIDAGAGRLNLGTSRNFVVRDANPAGTAASCNLTMDFWDAASGGTKIGTATFTLLANYYNPCPTCCFTPATPITMADGTTRMIGEIIEGDLIRVRNGIESVKGVLIRKNRPMYLVTLSNGRTLHMSDEHPIYVETKGYAAINPVVEYKDLGKARQLEVGDLVATLEGAVTVTSIEERPYPGKVYTLVNSHFFANGVLVY